MNISAEPIIYILIFVGVLVLVEVLLVRLDGLLQELAPFHDVRRRLGGAGPWGCGVPSDVSRLQPYPVQGANRANQGKSPTLDREPQKMARVSIEILYHYRCNACSQWWSVADIAPGDRVACPHCFTAQPVEEIENGAGEKVRGVEWSREDP